MMEPVNPSHPTKIHHDTTGTAERAAFLATFPSYLCYHSGAGKTTFASEYLPREAACPNFINADLIAAGLSPFDPAGAAVQAGRLMIREIRRYLQEGDSFAFETTLAGRSYALHIPDWQSADYRVELIFLKLRSFRLALARVKDRVAQGGHHVADSVVRRRFRLGWKNFEQVYRPLVDHWELYD